MTASKVEENIHVTADDQKLINRFARLHQKSIDVREKLDEMTRDLQNMSEASDEIFLLNDCDLQSIPYKTGSIFMHLDQERLQSKLQDMKEYLENQVAVLDEKLKSISRELGSLKAILYGKFGDSINLETDMDD
ncbi:unnamed protein product [Thelazia callipaeda]|uniref:Prefoldin subunit 4 n=1 Tax=Thelazia callipaeda TaxID=103827 RepID=A0A0N5D2A5_THECL|nr:unnamed protein product [Thelazia callipaeda]